MVPHCHKHEIDNINLTSVAKEFASANENRKTFLGNIFIDVLSLITGMKCGR